MNKTLAALALLMPVAAFAQPGARYHDGFGDPLLFAEVDIPIYDQTGHYLVDPTTHQPIPADFCLVVPANEEQTDVTKQISTSNTEWLQAIHYTLDLPHRQIIIRHVWVLDTIKTPASPGFRVIQSPRMVNYNLDDYRAPLLDRRPIGGQCNWDKLLANLTVRRNEPVESGSGGGGGTFTPYRPSRPTSAPTPTPRLLPCPSGMGHGVGGYCYRYSD